MYLDQTVLCPVGVNCPDHLICLFCLAHFTGHCVSRSITSDSLWPHGLGPTRLLCPWNSLGKNTGVGCHSLLQGILLTQGSNSGPLALHADFLPSEPLGKPFTRSHVSRKEKRYSKVVLAQNFPILLHCIHFAYLIIEPVLAFLFFSH